MRENLTHYKKVKITKDISLRYFYTFQTRKHFEGKWVIKSHSTRKYGVLDFSGVKILEKLHSFDLRHFEEIKGVIRQGIYNKTILKAKGKAKTFSKKIRIKN
jgi:hypothetical protein